VLTSFQKTFGNDYILRCGYFQIIVLTSYHLDPAYVFFEEVLQTLDHKLPDEENPEAYRQCLKAVVKELKLKAKDVFMPARCALTGQVHGPDLNMIMAVWGKKETSRRLQKAIERLDD
jgi:glutamyl/glutaminyl-tRNA synthetase